MSKILSATHRKIRRYKVFLVSKSVLRESVHRLFVTTVFLQYGCVNVSYLLREVCHTCDPNCQATTTDFATAKSNAEYCTLNF